MSRMLTIALAAVVATFACGVANAQIPSELKRMGFNGPVSTVRSEFIEYRWENARWDLIGDPIHDVTRFDASGRCLTPHTDPGSGWQSHGAPRPTTAARSQKYEIVRHVGGEMSWKSVWQFDNEGRLGRFEAYAIYESGPAISNWESYTYDSQGQLKELTYWADWGKSPGQTEPYPPVRLKYWFDSAGRIGGWARADDPKIRSTLTYDTRGRLLKQVDENEDGYVTTRAWDGYDEHGNWTLQTITQSWRTDDEDEPQHLTVLRRSITYRQVSNNR